MQPFQITNAHPVQLSATLPASDNRRRIHLVLRNPHGAHGSGVLDLTEVPSLSTGDTWPQFQAAYLNGDTGATDHLAFGTALHHAILSADPSIAAAWSAIQANADGGPLAMTLSLGPRTERFAALPLELLHDDAGFCFNRPDSALTRAFEHNPAASFDVPRDARVLFAWVCPPGAGDPFDPAPHADALQPLFAERMTVLPSAGIAAIEQALDQALADGAPYRLLHLLAHGSHDGDFGSIALTDVGGGLDLVEAQRLANVVRGSGLRLAFLCSCRSAVAGDRALSGVGQLLLSPAGGDLSTVIATQANLPVHRSAELAAGFYRQLAADAGERAVSPGAALARARVLAFQGTRVADAWSVPICLARPTLLPLDASERARVHRGRSSLPARRDSFQPRPEVMAQILPLLRRRRLISLVGLPGIGKTELGKEAARVLHDEPSGPRALYRQINRGFTPDRLRGLLAADLGRERPPQTDEELARLLDTEPTLLLLDNAEDMMADAAAQAAFAAQLDTWLESAPGLKILLTTRWQVTGTTEREHSLDIPPMTRSQTETLLLAELDDSDVLTAERQAHWTADPAWQRLLDFLDGHPRSVWLVSHHFEGPRASLPHIVARLEQGRAKAIVHPSLIGRADLQAPLPETSRRRMQSLVASIDFSFDVLRTRHPRAAAAFLLLAVFPAGLPEPVAQAVIAAAEGEDGDGLAADRLGQLYRYHLLEWQGHRTFYPVPLRWYAEHKRAERPDAPAPDLNAALAAYADYVEILDQGLVRDQEPTWIADWLLEEKTLIWLANEPRPPTPRIGGESAPPRSQLARVATAAQNLLGLAHRMDAWQRLVEAGLAEARVLGDRGGEANTLKALGDLFLRIAKLDEARNAYQDALPIYRQINARIGEANTQQGLELLALSNGDATAAFRRFAELPPIFVEIQGRLGLQAALGYMARAAVAMRHPDRALLLAGESLRIDREIDSRFGQTITLKLMLSLFSTTGDQTGLIAALVLYRGLLAEIGDARRLARTDGIWRQLEQQVPAAELERLRTQAPDLLDTALAAAHRRFGDGDPAQPD